MGSRTDRPERLQVDEDSMFGVTSMAPEWTFMPYRPRGFNSWSIRKWREAIDSRHTIAEGFQEVKYGK